MREKFYPTKVYPSKSSYFLRKSIIGAKETGNSWEKCIPESLLKLEDFIKKGLLISDMNFLQQTRGKLAALKYSKINGICRKGHFTLDVQDMRKEALLRVTHRRIKGYLDILEHSFEEDIPTFSSFQYKESVNLEGNQKHLLEDVKDEEISDCLADSNKLTQPHTKQRKIEIQNHSIAS
ncbi:uncharacterized protein LOC118766969 [Octopus sinensis]|uniref:Uncharacterized protein LOC118766969 n=1 Tax=Octopus sinensis TaxID=2607531 RepID=A0A7E6FGP4_9MOLL|nr:uncharacterized protein LOC118766969 [Octopus sinensis]